MRQGSSRPFYVPGGNVYVLDYFNQGGEVFTWGLQGTDIQVTVGPGESGSMSIDGKQGFWTRSTFNCPSGFCQGSIKIF
jgi:hypothetical protein